MYQPYSAGSFCSRAAVVAAVAAAVIVTLISCSEDRVTDPNLTKVSRIASYISEDPVGKHALPVIWFDTTSKADIYGKRIAKPIAEAQTPINPLDYWIGVSRVGRGITLRDPDTCQLEITINEMIGDSVIDADTVVNCDRILLSNGSRADSEIALLNDTVVCTYYIVDRSDSTVYTKDITYRESKTALISRLDSGISSYDGWRLYAIGRQRFQTGVVPNRFPAIDSIMVQSLDRPSRIFVAYPDKSIRYDWTGDLLKLQPGELLAVTVFSRARFGNPPIRDAYVHYKKNGEFVHEWMGNDVSVNPDVQKHTWQIIEASGGLSNEFSQITLELFQGDALRDSSPSEFKALLWAISYQLE